MEQSERVSIEQLLVMTPQEGAAYMKALPPEERKKVGREIQLAISKRTAEAMVESLNTHKDLPTK